MFNRYIDVRKDFSRVNKHTNKIVPIIDSAKFKTEEEKQLVLNYVHEIFFNQWICKYQYLMESEEE